MICFQNVEIKISGLFCFVFLGVLRLSGRELGDGFGSFGNSVLGKFTRKHQTDRGLDFTGRKCGLLVVRCQFPGFGGDPFEDIVNERIHDRHTLLGDTGIGMDLFQDLVNVRRVRFDSLLLSFATGGTSTLGGCLFACGLAGCFRHFGIFV